MFGFSVLSNTLKQTLVNDLVHLPSLKEYISL